MKKGFLVILMISFALLACNLAGYAQSDQDKTGEEYFEDAFVAFTDAALNQELIEFVAIEKGLLAEDIKVEKTLKLDEGFGSIFLKATLSGPEDTYTVQGLKVTDDPEPKWDFCLD